MKTKCQRVKNLFTYQCPKLPYEITSIYQNAFLFVMVVLTVMQIGAIVLKSLGIICYGPYTRILETVSFTCLSISAWVFCKYCKQYAYIYSGASGIVMMVAYFEIIIKYNEAEEGIIFFSIYSSVSLVFLDLFRYYWAMILYQVLITLYVYLRIMKFKAHTNIISTLDSIYYSGVTCIVMCILFYIFTTIFNIIANEHNKTKKLLESWKIMMNSSPIGIIISKKQQILYYNMYAQDILTKINLTVSESSLSKLTQFEAVSQINNIKTIKILSSYIYYDLKQIVFENDEATLTILNDITKVFEFQAQQNQHQMLEMLVATSTHELRTPLHCIKNTLQLINDEGLTKEMDSLSRAMSACEMQECYINDILDFAKLKSNNLVLVKEPINVADILAEVYSYFESLARENQILLKLECKFENMHINADNIRLKQVLFNLMSNALKFTQEGQIILTAYPRNEKVHIEVQDSGIGMTVDEINNLFKPFSVAESTRKYNKSGTGLGLFLSMKLCQLMEGEIAVNSKKNIGSTFTLIFTLLPQNVVYPIKKRKLSKMSSVCLSSKFMDCITSNKVLIVDDNGFNCNILEKMLNTLNVGSYKALNGKCALEYIKSKADIKLAFVDLNMPVMDGYELCGCVKQYYNEIGKPSIPMYALSGDSTNDARMKCMKIGFRGLLTKPFTKRMLMEVLSQY